MTLLIALALLVATVAANVTAWKLLRPAPKAKPVYAPHAMTLDPRLDEDRAQFRMPRRGPRDGDL